MQSIRRRRRNQHLAWTVVYWIVVLLAPFAARPVVAQAKPEAPDLSAVRAALEKYKDPYVAIHDGYFSTLGCVEFERPGAAGHVPYKPGGMGVHFINVGLIGPVPDPAKPQVLLYEPDGDKLRLVGAEWFIPLATGVKERPTLWSRAFDGPMTGTSPVASDGDDPLRPSRVALQGESLGNLRADQPEREVHGSPLSPGRGVAEAGAGAEVATTPREGSMSIGGPAASRVATREPDLRLLYVVLIPVGLYFLVAHAVPRLVVTEAGYGDYYGGRLGVLGHTPVAR